MADDWIRLGASRLSLGIAHGPDVVVATLVGTADEAALATILEGGIRLLDAAGAALVMDVRGLEEATGRGAQALVRVAREAQRLGKELRLVGCSEVLEHALRAVGLRGDFWHYPSLAAATDGLLSEPGHALTVYLRRSRATRARLRLLVASLAQPCRMDDDDQARLVVALDDVCSLAAQSSLGDEEPLTLCFYARDNMLTADVGWRVPPALLRDTEEIWTRRPSARARVAASVDDVATLVQADGVVIRLMRQTNGKAASATLDDGTRPIVLPDTPARQAAGSRPAARRPERVRPFSWKEWSRRSRFPFVAGLAGRSVGLRKGVTGERKNGEGSE